MVQSAFPVRGALGAVVGGAGGGTLGTLFHVVLSSPRIESILITAVLAGSGAAVGAVLGATADILRRLPDRPRAREGPEADYLDDEGRG